MEDLAASILLGCIDSDVLSDEEIAFFQETQPAGVTLFSRNINRTQQEQSLKKLTEALQGLNRRSETPFLIAIDQEGGRVARLKHPFPNAGPALHLGKGLPQEAARKKIYQYALEVGASLCNLGININFAPVLDIFTNPENEAIGDRCFGSTLDEVIWKAGAFLDGLNVSNVMPCLKHFPGQGDASFDTHLHSSPIYSKIAD